jgi:hypothetical protein
MPVSSARAAKVAIFTAVLAIAAHPPAFAAGGYKAKPPSPYRGPCALTAPQIPSVAAGGRCVAVASP